MPTIPPLDHWLRRSSKGLIDKRSARLQRIDTALRAYHVSSAPKTLELLADALRDYKRAKHGWFHSARNRHRALSDLSAAVSERMEATRLQEAYIWCPGIDAEMQGVGANMIENLKLHPTLHTAGADLSRFSVKARLHILAHGHSRMPLFTTKAGRWTADELAGMLLDCGLSTEIRHITMLVCHAGESVNTIENSRTLMDIQARFNAAKAAQDEAQKALLTEAFNQAASGARAPRFYERADDSAQAIARQSEQLLPMAAQLSAAMKKLGFSHFALESYKAPVNQSASPMTYFGGRKTDAGIRLDLTSKVDDDPQLKKLWEASDHVAVAYALASDHPQYKAVWR